MRGHQIPILRSPELVVDHDPNQSEGADLGEQEQDFRPSPVSAEVGGSHEHHHETYRRRKEKLIEEILPVEEGK